MSALAACAGSPESTVVPGVRSANLFWAYERMRAANLRVSIPKAVTIDSLCTPILRRHRPAGGTSLAEGSVVTFEESFCFRASPTTRDHAVRVPDFAGRPASEAVQWAESEEMLWSARLPPLRAGEAKHLLDNYVVVGQQPKAGSMLRRGILDGATFRMTPLTLSLEQR